MSASVFFNDELPAIEPGYAYIGWASDVFRGGNYDGNILATCDFSAENALNAKTECVMAFMESVRK